MSVRSCAVHSCSNTTFKNPNLVFFALPRDAFMREEWMEVLSLRHKDISDQVRVCELHFKAKDFCSGKKQLKHHAVPAIRLGRGKNFIEVDSDDEFMQCNSDSDPEIIEIKKLSEEFLSSKEKKKEIAVVKTEVMSETESTSTETAGTGRRPSRRAARVAAEKISSVVRKFGISDEPPTKKEPSPKFRDQKEWHAIKVPLPDIDLMMECHEELLSAVQAECLLKAQLEYNMVMKKLRMLKASKARIVCSLADESDNADHSANNCMLSEESDVASSTEVVLTPTAPQLIKEEPPVSSPEINCDNASVVPVKLSAAFEQPLISNQIAQLSLLEATGKKSPEPAISEVLTTTSTPAVSKKTFLLIKKSSDPSQQVSYKLMLNSIPGVPSEKSVRVIPVSTISTRSQGIGLQCQKTYGKKPKVPGLSVDNTSVSSDESIFSKETSNSDMGRLIGRLPDGLTILQNIPASQSGYLML